jgi:(2S)-methylsuccinyl-CoA dehydrogenase
MEGRAIDTLGYCACTPMRSPSTDGSCRTTALIGGEAGLGRGFYYQMEGFENGRLQTPRGRRSHAAPGGRGGAAQYADSVFGRPVGEYQLTQEARSHGDRHPGGSS